MSSPGRQALALQAHGCHASWNLALRPHSKDAAQKADGRDHGVRLRPPCFPEVALSGVVRIRWVSPGFCSLQSTVALASPINPSCPSSARSRGLRCCRLRSRHATRSCVAAAACEKQAGERRNEEEREAKEAKEEHEQRGCERQTQQDSECRGERTGGRDERVSSSWSKLTEDDGEDGRNEREATRKEGGRDRTQ